MVTLHVVRIRQFYAEKTMLTKLIAVLLFPLACYLMWWAISAWAPYWLIPSVLLLTTSIGLYTHRRWARYLWHTIALLANLYWIVPTIRLALHDWPYANTQSTIISLAPGLLLLMVCLLVSVIINKRYNQPSQ